MTKLREALEILRERGMCKFYLEKTSHVCARGAVHMAHTGSTQWCMDGWIGGTIETDMQLLTAIVVEQYPDRREVDPPTPMGFEVTDFNNHPTTTQAELEAIFEKAILRRGEAT